MQYYNIRDNGLYYKAEGCNEEDSEEWRDCLVASRGKEVVKVLWSCDEHKNEIVNEN